MNQSRPKTHLMAGALFVAMAITTSWLTRSSVDNRWRVFALLSLGAAALAWIMFVRAHHREAVRKKDQYSAYPEGHARLIDAGRLPNRFNHRIEMREYETCHFSVEAWRILFRALPDNHPADPANVMVRLSGGSYYFIIRPQEILLPAEPDSEFAGEFIITSQRVVFAANENGFEVPLQSLKLLDCSAHLVDFQVRGRRYTIRTEAACYVEKVLMLLQQPPSA